MIKSRDEYSTRLKSISEGERYGTRVDQEITILTTRFDGEKRSLSFFPSERIGLAGRLRGGAYSIEENATL